MRGASGVSYSGRGVASETGVWVAFRLRDCADCGWAEGRRLGVADIVVGEELL